MKSNNITTDRTLNALRRHLSRTFLLLSLLTLGVGQMWAYWHVPGTHVSTGWTVADNNASCMNSSNTITFYNVSAGTYQFKLVKGDTWGNGNYSNLSSDYITSVTKNGAGDNDQIVIKKACDLTFTITNQDYWNCNVSATDPTFYIRYSWNNGSSTWSGTLTANGDNTYSCTGQYGTSNTYYHTRLSSTQTAGGTSGTATVLNSPSRGDLCVFTFNASNNSLTITRCNKVTKTNYIYFYNADDILPNPHKYFVIGHDKPTAFSKVIDGYYSTNIPHTKLAHWRNTTDTWNDATYYAFCSPSSEWANGDWGSSNLSNAGHYTAAFTNKQDLASGKYYMAIMFSGEGNGGRFSMEQQDSYTAFNKSQYATRIVLNNGATNFANSADNSVGSVSITGWYLSTPGGCSSNTAEVGSNESNHVSAAYSGEVTYTAVPGAGYTFAGWYDTKPTTLGTGTLLSTELEYTRYAPYAADYVYAAFIQETSHDVTIQEVCTSTSTEISSSVRAIGELTYATITAPEIYGYTFVRWVKSAGIELKDGDLLANTTIHVKTKTSGPYVLTATYTEDLSSPFIVTGGNKIVTSGTAWRTTADANNKMTKKTGYSSSYDAYFTVSVTAVNQGNANSNYQFKLYNTNTSTHYGLTGTGQYYLNRSESGTAKAMSTPGINVELRADALGEYEIKVNYSSTPTLTVTYPTAYTMTYSIGSVAGTSGSISAKYGTTSFSSGTKIQSGKSVTLTAPAAKDGYTWKGWYTNAAGTTGKINDTNRAITVTMNADKTLYACYTENAWSTTVSAGANGSVTPSGSVDIKQVSGTSITASPNTGYSFSSWTISGGGITPSSSSSATQTFKATSAGGTITANFSENTYTVNVASGNTAFGSVSTSSVSGVGIATTSGNITATPVTGATFTGWTLPSGVTAAAGYTSSSNPIKINATASGKAITANFSETKYTATINTANSSQGTVSPTSASVGRLTAVQITATPKSGYMFNGWTKTAGSGTVTYYTGAGTGQVVDASGASKATTYITTTANVTLQATWDEDRSSGYFVHYGNDGKNADGGTDASQTRAWSDGNLYKKSGETTGTVSYWTFTASAADVTKVIEFKVLRGDPANLGSATWYGYNAAGGGKIEASITNAVLSTSYGNGRLCIVAPGDYVFKWDSNGNKLSITFPDGNYIRGDFNSWGWDHALTPTGNANEYSCTISLSANQTWTAPDHGFKVVFGGVHYGKNSTSITRAANSATPLSSSGANIGLKTDLAGTYTFTYNSSSKTITITYPAAFSVTYNGNSPTSGSIPDVSGTYYAAGSDVTLATNTGILFKTGCAFGGWNTNAAGGTETHYESGGTLSSINEPKTLYAEWKANDNHMYFYNKDGWSAVAAYMWSAANDPERAYPGRTMTLHQGKVYKIDYRSDVQAKVVFNNNRSDAGELKTGDVTLPGVLAGDHWFYNDADKNVTTGGINNGWSQYIMVADFPTSTVAAVVGERITISPVLAWAEDVTFNDIEITSTRTDGDASVNAIISGTNIIVSGTTANTSATFTIKYKYSTTTITKTLTVEIKNGVVIQARIAKTDNHWVYTNIVKMHYWGTGISAGDITMNWIKDDGTYNYYQACVPFGTDNKANFLFFYDYMDDYGTNTQWRQTNNITNVTLPTCYTISYSGSESSHSNCTSSGSGLCTDSWQVRVIMGSGEVYTSNAVEDNTSIISFFAPSNANETHSYRRGVVTLEHNGQTVATISAGTFTESNVYTAKVKTTSAYGLTNLALYTGNYYIRTNPSHGGWDNYKTDPLNKMTHFNRNPNFPNETFSYYWVDNVAKTPGDPVNIKATVANDYNPVLCGFSADETVTREEHGINLRFGYEPTTNDLIRGILRGSNENNFLNVIDGNTNNIYRDAACGSGTLMNESLYASHPEYSKMLDKSNWVYEINAYAKIDADHRAATVYLKSYFNGIHYLLGMEKDEDGRDTDTPIKLPIIATGSTYDTYSLRVVYDFKTNRLFAAWAPADITIPGNMTVDADVMFLRHEQGDVAQISFANTSVKVSELNKAIFAVEIEDDQNKANGNRELHYFFSLPFDCYVKDIFGIGGFMEYWGIQYYDGAERARIGWFVETPTFWKWLGENDLLEAGKGYLLSIDKKALQTGDQWKSVHFMDFVNGVWKDQGAQSILTLYFPSAGSGFSMEAASGVAQTITYPNEPCSITRDDRDQKDSNWKCIGTPGYKNMTMTGYTPTTPAPPVWDGNTPPKFLYEFQEQTTNATYAKGTYTVVNGSTFTYHAFHSYMVQYAGTINWGAYTMGNGPAAIAARRVQQSEMNQPTNVQIDLLSEDSTMLDRTFVWLREDATTAYDQNYDLNKMVESKANQIYSLSDRNVPFAANVLPYETDTVPLVVNIYNPGEYTFSLNKEEHFGLAPVLYDMYKSEQIDLLSSDYSVELTKGKYTDRFYLLFSPVRPIATDIETTEDGSQHVLSGEAIYDVLGRRVSTITPGHLYIVNGEKRIAQ